MIVGSAGSHLAHADAQFVVVPCELGRHPGMEDLDAVDAELEELRYQPLVTRIDIRMGNRADPTCISDQLECLVDSEPGLRDESRTSGREIEIERFLHRDADAGVDEHLTDVRTSHRTGTADSPDLLLNDRYPEGSELLDDSLSP